MKELTFSPGGEFRKHCKQYPKKGRNLNCVPQNTTEAVQHEYNVGGLFVWAVGEDDKNSSQVKFIDKHKKSHFEKT